MKLNKEMPNVLELEEAVLGAIMLEKNAILKAVNILKPEYLYHDKHVKIFNAILDLFKNSNPIDILTVTNKLRERNDLESAGGAVYISHLTNKVNSSANIEFHVRIITENYLRRAMIFMADDLSKKSFDPTENVFDTISYVSKNITDTLNVSSGDKIKNASQIYLETCDWLSDKKGARERMIVTGIEKIDKIIQEFAPGEVTLLCGRPSMGKTTLAINYMKNIAYFQNKKVLFFSLEMTRIRVLQKMLSNLTGLGTKQLNPRNMNEDYFKKIFAEAGIFSTGTLLIDDSPARSILNIKAKGIAAKLTHDIDCIFIDHFHMLEDRSTKYSTKEQEHSYCSAVIKDLAKELDIPLIVLAQLSRANENRSDKRPNLSDIRGSGSLEQDADIVQFIHRPDYYDKNNESLSGDTEIIIEKNRNGETGFVNISHDLAKNRFW
jgi:replicative DNA helicase